MNLINKILKLLMPSEEKMALWAAQKIQSLVNDSQKAEQIAHYGAIADKATEVQKWLTEMLKDGTIDGKEAEEIAEKLTPIFGTLKRMM